MGFPFVVTPLRAHRRRPIFQIAKTLGQRRIGQADLDAAAEIALRRLSEITGNTETKNFAHGIPFL